MKHLIYFFITFSFCLTTYANDNVTCFEEAQAYYNKFASNMDYPMPRTWNEHSSFDKENDSRYLSEEEILEVEQLLPSSYVLRGTVYSQPSSGFEPDSYFHIILVSKDDCSLEKIFKYDWLNGTAG